MPKPKPIIIDLISTAAEADVKQCDKIVEELLTEEQGAKLLFSEVLQRLEAKKMKHDLIRKYCGALYTFASANGFDVTIEKKKKPQILGRLSSL